VLVTAALVGIHLVHFATNMILSPFQTPHNTPPKKVLLGGLNALSQAHSGSTFLDPSYSSSKCKRRRRLTEVDCQSTTPESSSTPTMLSQCQELLDAPGVLVVTRDDLFNESPSSQSATLGSVTFHHHFAYESAEKEKTDLEWMLENFYYHKNPR
jgi:hypothetical protein